MGESYFTIQINTQQFDTSNNIFSTREPLSSKYKIKIHLVRNYFRSVFEDPSNTETGSFYNGAHINEKLKIFFNKNYELLAKDFYKLISSNFTDLSVDFAQFKNEFKLDENISGVFARYLLTSYSKFTDKDDIILKISDSIATNLEYMIQNYDSDNNYHYTNFWNNAVIGSNISIRGSIQTESKETIYHGIPGLLPFEISFILSDYSYGYSKSDFKRQNKNILYYPFGSYRLHQVQKEFFDTWVSYNFSIGSFNAQYSLELTTTEMENLVTLKENQTSGNDDQRDDLLPRCIMGTFHTSKSLDKTFSYFSYLQQEIPSVVSQVRIISQGDDFTQDHIPTRVNIFHTENVVQEVNFG